jgi:hypothetical protein
MQTAQAQLERPGQHCPEPGNARRFDRLLGRLTGVPLRELEYSRIVRCCSFPPRCYESADSSHTLPYNMVAVESPHPFCMDVKTTYFSTDGVPRAMMLSRDGDDTHEWALHVAAISLRGVGKRMWLEGDKNGLKRTGWAAISAAETDSLIARERDELRRLFHEKGGMRSEGCECNFDFSEQLGMLIGRLDGPAGETAGRLDGVIGKPILVPPDYPFSVPLEITSGCSRTARCRMCSLPAKDGRLDTIDSVKDAIRRWAAALGPLVASTQSVFLGRNSLPKPDLLHGALEFLKSEEIYDIVTKDLPYDLEAFMDCRRMEWGNIARFSAFATPREINAYTADALAELHRMGLARIYLALETGSDSLRRGTLGKDYDCAELEAALDKVCAAGMFPRVIFMLGVGGSARREEHIAETARALSRLQNIADGHKRRMIFLASPLDTGLMPDSVLMKTGMPGMEDMADELNAIGRMRMGHNELRGYMESGARMMLDGGKTARVQLYHYPTLFV